MHFKDLKTIYIICNISRITVMFFLLDYLKNFKIVKSKLYDLCRKFNYKNNDVWSF